MTRNVMICVALLLAVPAAAQEQAAAPVAPAGEEAQPAAVGSNSDPQDFDIARKKVVDCEGEKFVFAWGAGARPTKVTLCSNKDSTPDEVIRMLEESAAKLEVTASIEEDRRIMIVKQIRAKIAELQKIRDAAPPPAAVAEAPILSPGPAPIAVQPIVPQPAPQPAIAVPAPPRPVPVAARRILPAKPSLAFECYTPGEIGSGGPCTILGRDTRLTLKAREAVAAGMSLRFVRNGETRAEIPLDPMRKGQSARIMLPRALCTGVSETEAKVQIFNGGHAFDLIGPFLLRC
ncbi:MAG TPA: hypothetical protein VFU80_03545 [Sphingomicrobium sp.]|nr:hypothetical protein [Sphingomicrobium sp.]